MNVRIFSDESLLRLEVASSSAVSLIPLFSEGNNKLKRDKMVYYKVPFKRFFNSKSMLRMAKGWIQSPFNVDDQKDEH